MINTDCAGVNHKVFFENVSFELWHQTRNNLRWQVRNQVWFKVYLQVWHKVFR